MIDIRGKPVEITISEDRKTVWVNTIEGCQFRAQSIPELKIVDSHKKKSEFISERACWAFMLFWIGGIGFGWLFDVLGLGNPGAGVIIGGVLGVILGYLIGNRIEKKRLKK